MGETKAPGIDFGVMIAFVAPGFLALIALSWFSPEVKRWLTAAGEADQSIGIFLFALLAALSLGLAVSGVRAQVIDKLYCSPMLWRLRIARPEIEWARLDAERLATVVALRDNFYRYFQFYANMAVALACWVAARGSHGAYRGHEFELGLHVVAIAVLLCSAHDSMHRYSDALHQMKE